MATPNKILIVDDEAHVRNYLGLLVRTELGISNVIEAVDAKTAVELYISERPDMVLLDIHLVSSSGLVALEEIRRADPDAAVVMLTGVAATPSINEALFKGAVGYLLKDAPFEEITKSLRDIIGSAFGDDSTPPAPPSS